MLVLSENLFKVMTQDKEYNVPTPEDEKIVALQAEITKLNKNWGGGNNKKADIGGGTPKKTEKKPDKPAWMIKEPSGDEPTSTTSNGKTYWWCPKHSSFGRHEPSDCEGKGTYVKKPAPLSTGGTQREKKFASAMSAFLGHDDDEEQDEE